MSITFVGDKKTKSEDIETPKDRVITDFYSFDRAFQDARGSIGFPLPSFVEVSGYKGVGKTSACLGILAILATKLQKRISIADFEIQDDATIDDICNNAGYSGEINFIRNHADERTEDTLERTIDLLLEDNPDVILLDSIGAFSPTAEIEGKIGDSNMGIKAREVGQLSKKVVYHMSKGLLSDGVPTAFFTTNHQHPNIGFPGTNTSGGVTKNFMAHIQIKLKKVNAFDYDELGWLLEGSVDKNRYGYTDKTFTVFLIPGIGIHQGLSNIFDCVMYDYAKIDNGILSMDGQKFGRIKSVIKNREHEKDVFIPFINRLKQVEIESEIINEIENNETSSESDDKAKVQSTKRGRKKK